MTCWWPWCCGDGGCPLDPDAQTDFDSIASSLGEPSVDIDLLSGCYELIIPEWEAPGCCSAGYTGSHLLLNNLTYPVSSVYDSASLPHGVRWSTRIKASPWSVFGNPGSFSIATQDPDACATAANRPLVHMFFFPGYAGSGSDGRWVMEMALDFEGGGVGGIARYICDTDVPGTFIKTRQNFPMCGSTNPWPNELTIEPTDLPE